LKIREPRTLSLEQISSNALDVLRKPIATPSKEQQIFTTPDQKFSRWIKYSIVAFVALFAYFLVTDLAMLLTAQAMVVANWPLTPYPYTSCSVPFER
jgi:hypothetical protein